MIYLIHNTNNNTLKIGKSNNPKKRLAALQTGTSDELKLLKIIRGFDDFKFKKIYSKYHLIREWYSYSEEIILTFENHSCKIEDLFKEKKLKTSVKLNKNPNYISIETIFKTEKDVLRMENRISKMAIEHFNFIEKIIIKDYQFNKVYKKSLLFYSLNK